MSLTQPIREALDRALEFLTGHLVRRDHVEVVAFAKEEEVYLPVLDEQLTPDTARALFARMHEAAVRASGLQHA